MQDEQANKSFEFRNKLESWVEGLFDTTSAYIKTIFFFNLRPYKASRLLSSEDPPSVDFTRPGIYLIVSYLTMALLLRHVDFSDKDFAFDLGALLNAVGVIDAAKKLDVEAIIVGILPAILMLFVFVYIGTGIMYVFRERDKTIPLILRHRYSYLIGNFFLLVGIVAFGHSVLVKPLEAKSHFWGQMASYATLLPLVGCIMLSIYPFLKSEIRPKRRIIELIAGLIPWVLLIFWVRIFTGQWYLIK